jgi:[glutamine synthetase] adenylyltransferase / [glutamine synthetase]-adenylyl-L-tyrosine phosphorylase
MTWARAQVLAGAPDPEDAARRFERIAEAAEEAGVHLVLDDPDAGELLRISCQKAPYLATLLARDPARLGRVASDPYLRRQKPAWVMARELAARIAGGEELSPALRRYRADEMVRLGARELGLGSPIEVGAELAHLADICLDSAIAHHTAELAAQHGPPLVRGDDGSERAAELAVIGMGKLGGEELNFASDIDVIYVYSSDQGAAGELSLHEFMSKLCERVTAAMSEMTGEDLVFRVDLRLRPEGSRGAIANSLPSLERYYETWGRPWERQAWLKARAAAGSRALGAEVLALLEPFVHPRTTSVSVVADVHDLNRRIKAELVRGGVDSGFDVKNGAGGIREIEFFAQALQLIHAGHRPALRTRSTLGALDQLLFAGIIPDSERTALAEAYRFLRHIEHLLQLETGRQTQRMPNQRDALELFARRLGHEGADDLLAVLAAHTGAVARLFATLGEEEEGPPAGVVALLRAEQGAGEERELLAQLGLRDPEQAQRHLERARRRVTSPFGRAAEGARARVAPLILADALESPDPDQALAWLAELAHRRGAWTTLWRMMDENPPLRRLIASLFGSSAYLSKQFIDHPEMGDALLAAGRARARRTIDELDEMAAARLAEVPPDDDEGRWNGLAEVKNAQILRIGLADIAGELGPEEVCAQLSAVAEVCLARGFELVRAALAERHGVARGEDGAPVGLAVLALGKLGGRELGYASDLDVLFVYRGEGESDGERPLPNVEYMTRLAQRLMGGLHTMHPAGRLYEVDTRLRPSGSKGLLVSSLAGWTRYHQESARLWERQALTRLRPVAGDPEVGARAAEVASAFAYRGEIDPGELAGEMTAMRDKIERETAGGAGQVDLKAGRGGLIDIEFASQYIQLVLGPAEPALRTPSTLEALRAAVRLVPELSGACALLADAYLYLRRIEHRIRIVHDASAQRLPHDAVERDKLARRLGLADGSALDASYRRWTGDVRRAYDAVLAWRK